MGAYSKGGLIYFSDHIVDHIPFEILLPMSYCLMLLIQAICHFLKGIRFFVN